uniref:HDC15892 n=1 Tax=Drosophila melanogaster TaxID=7227 RepID=Q6IJ51_DROME|nr:TPA_inf: HDC15892 [Drosophila melanogaster]
MNIRPERPEEATNPEILGGNMTQFELKFWPRSSGCFPASHGICGSLAGCLSASVYLYLFLPELLTAGTVRGQGG